MRPVGTLTDEERREQIWKPYQTSVVFHNAKIRDAQMYNKKYSYSHLCRGLSDFLHSVR